MLKRGAGGKGNYNPYATGHRNKKTESKEKTKLDLLPNKPSVWLKQLSILQELPHRDATASSPPCPPPSGYPDPSPSSPATPTVPHSTRLAGCPSPANTIKRPMALSRHASAAGLPLQSWVLTKAQVKGIIAQSSVQDGGDGGVAIEVEEIPALLRHVARFAEAVEKLKDVVLGEDKQENQQPLAHECLGEVMWVLRQVISTYPLLNTVEILIATGKLISKVKGFHYDGCNEAEKKDFEKAIETIAVAFSSNVSELLMGELDSSSFLSQLPTEKSRSMENLCGASGQGSEGSQLKSELKHFVMTAEEVDIILQRSEGGVDSALAYAKTISKYMKDLMTYVEKRMALEVEFAKGLQRLYHSSKQSIAQPHMPFFDIYATDLEQDREQSLSLQSATTSQQTQSVLQPLTQRKLEHEKTRKEIKELWHRAKRKLMECESNLRKAKQAYMARCEDYDKAKTAASRLEEEGSGSTARSLEKKRRVEEEARNKMEEAEATYRTCIADATTQQQELEHTKVTVLRHIQELIKRSDQTLRSATVSYHQTMHMQTVALPVHYQSMCENSKLYEPGLQYAAHVSELEMPAEAEVRYDFEAYTASISQQQARQQARQRNDSFNTDQKNVDNSTCGVEAAAGGDGGPTPNGDQRKKQSHLTHKSSGSTLSDTDSVSGGLGSPTNSTGDITKMVRTSSTGTMSSNEDPDEKDGNVASFEAPNVNGIEPELVVPGGPFRSCGLSTAAQSHRLRKLRTPSKCRECDCYVYFHGAECEECFLACHKKCLELLAIQCGHKKLYGRLHLFGRDFSQVSASSGDGVPFIIKKCISEIERRAMRMKGIYRVNGVKTRVEKLCQTFENGKELVELSQSSPHDISNVLKLYLRQLPEPIVPFRLYHRLVGLAKESLQTEGPAGKAAELVDLGPDTDPEVQALVEKTRDVLGEMPKANVATLQYIVRHLRRIAELEQDNKMSPSNLGIVFGPSLIRPRPTGATVSLSSLVDYPHQARIIETLIIFHLAIFQLDSKSSGLSGPMPATSALQDGRTDEGKSRGDCGEKNKGNDEQSRTDGDKTEESCGSSQGSLASRERSLDSDSEWDEKGRWSSHKPLVKQASELSAEEVLSSRDSLDQASPSRDDPDREKPPVPDSEPPAGSDGEPSEPENSERKLKASFAELNVSHSDDN